METQIKENLTVKDYCVAGAIALSALAVYLHTLAPTVTGEDSGELITAAAAFGVAHPPGYPLWCGLGRLFTLLPVGTIAYRINLMSAVFGALSTGVLYLISRNYSSSIPTAAAASLAFAFSVRLWSQSVVAEVYTLNIFLILLCLLFLQKWEIRRDRIWLFAASLVLGFGLSNHYMLLLLAVPGLLGYVIAAEPRIAFRGRLILVSLACLLPGLLVYIYLPLAASGSPPFNWGDPSSLGAFVRHVGRFQYRSLELGEKITVSTKLLFTGHFLVELWRQFTPYVLVLCAWGAGIALRRSRTAIPTYGVFFLNSVGLIAILHFSFEGENLERVQEYYLPAYAMAAVWLGLGMERLLTITRTSKGRRILGYLVLPAVVLLPLIYNYRENDRAGDYLAYDYNLAILKSLGKDAVYIPAGDYSSFPAIYLQAVEKVRPDIILGNVTGYLSPEYMKYARSLQGYTDKLSGKELESFVIRNTDRPVYYNQKSDIPERGTLAVIPWGLTFRVLPKDKEGMVMPRWDSDDALRSKAGSTTTNLVDLSILTDFHVKKGEFFFSIGEREMGEEEWEMASEISRDNKEVLNNIGCGYAEQGLFREAEGKFERAIGIFPGYKLGFKNLARLYEETGKLQDAVVAYISLSDLEPENELYLRKLKELASKTGSQRIAEQVERIAVKPAEPSAWNNLGNMYAEEGSYPAAIASYKRALHLNSGYALPHRNLSLAWISTDPQIRVSGALTVLGSSAYLSAKS
jgi:tetratricopeptide (TPR) repeat protein